MRVFILVIAAFLLQHSTAQSQFPGGKKVVEASPAKVVFAFLDWYRANNDTLNHMPLVNYHDGAVDSMGNVKDSSAFYTVNFKATENWLSKLHSSGFISSQYLERQRKYFRECEDNFQANHVYDGPPEGFDADLVMLSQDYELNELDKAIATVRINNSQTATVQLAFTYNQLVLIYGMTLEKGVWKIASIRNAMDK